MCARCGLQMERQIGKSRRKKLFEKLLLLNANMKLCKRLDVKIIKR